MFLKSTQQLSRSGYVCALLVQLLPIKEALQCNNQPCTPNEINFTTLEHTLTPWTERQKQWRDITLLDPAYRQQEQRDQDWGALEAQYKVRRLSDSQQPGRGDVGPLRPPNTLTPEDLVVKLRAVKKSGHKPADIDSGSIKQPLRKIEVYHP
jgi:hypothetical protein